MIVVEEVAAREDTVRVADLRRRVRESMEEPPVQWECPARIDKQYMSEPLPVRKARAMALKLSLMPTDLWDCLLYTSDAADE